MQSSLPLELDQLEALTASRGSDTVARTRERGSFGLRVAASLGRHGYVFLPFNQGPALVLSRIRASPNETGLESKV